jgi:MFS family permease
MRKDRLVTFEFLSLCFITFLAICNVAVFYNFHLYLQGIGLSGKEAGSLIGLYSLSAMVLYITVSKRIRLNNAPGCMLTGMVLVASCGAAYLFAERFWILALVRAVSGIGMFLIMASCTVMLVAIIPPKKTGWAFSAYSVALLLPYSIMPAVSELLLPLLGKPTILYTLTACLFAPAALLVLPLRARLVPQSQEMEPQHTECAHGSAARRNLFRKPVFSILLVNGIYFTIFSALFYLFEGFAVERGIQNPGFFFTAQMGVMIVIRLFGGRIFDHFSKVALATTALAITGTGIGLLRILPDTTWILPIATVFGLGMGLCVPALNSLMYLVTPPQYRGYNANMMMFAVHLGTFTGPFFGSWIIERGGYDHFLTLSIVVAVGAAGFFAAVNPAQAIAGNREQ